MMSMASSHAKKPLLPRRLASSLCALCCYACSFAAAGGRLPPAPVAAATAFASSRGGLTRRRGGIAGAFVPRLGVGPPTARRDAGRRAAAATREMSVAPRADADATGMARAAGGEDADAAYFDEGQFSAFESALEEMTATRNAFRELPNAELAPVKEHLLDRRRQLLPRWGIERFLPPPGTTSDASEARGEEAGTAAGPFQYARQKLQKRRDMYLDRTGLTPQHHHLTTVLLAHLADYCAKQSSPGPLHIAWEKTLEAGLTPMSRTLSTYLYVLGLEGDGGDRDVPAEVAAFHDALYAPTEKTTALRVKSLVARGDAAGAEALLDELAGGPLGALRHRTTVPVLRLHCARGDTPAAFRLYKRMRDTSRVKMDEATYADFVAAAAAAGCFRAGAPDVAGAAALGYAPAGGPPLLDALLAEMAEDVLDIAEDSARALRDGCAAGCRDGGPAPRDAPGEDVPPRTTLCEEGALVAARVAVDAATARCPATGVALRLIVLERSQRVHVHDTLLAMARDKSTDYTAKLAAKGRITHDNVGKAERAAQVLAEFSAWLDAREGRPYTAIVDGANVAYFGWGKVNVHQLRHMVEALEAQGEYPLVVFPQKYTYKKFHLRRGMMQVLQDEEVEFLDELKEKGQMYVVPPMCLDDLYWMLASVSNQTTATAGDTIDVPKNNTAGRFPGLRPMVISNDKMRDHKMDLLEERAFRRWCCSHIVNYNFTGFIESSDEPREISLTAADVFSDEIQGNAWGGGNEGGGGTVWHFPVSEWDSNERFCLRLPG